MKRSFRQCCSSFCHIVKAFQNVIPQRLQLVPGITRSILTSILYPSCAQLIINTSFTIHQLTLISIISYNNTDFISSYVTQGTFAAVKEDALEDLDMADGREIMEDVGVGSMMDKSWLMPPSALALPRADLGSMATDFFPSISLPVNDLST